MSLTADEANRSLSLNAEQPCCCFSLAEIQSATRNFDEQLVIGHGGFGKVYKGCISINQNSHVVAIKRLDSMSTQGALEFRAEIEMLSKLRHCHLVTLIGFCDDNKEMILVYDYMPNGTLHDHLHKADTPLSWVQRLKIAIGAARGLDYLHTGVGTKHGVMHRDIKSSNILLDENLAAMISDFGLSKIGPTNQSSSYIDASVKGTFGYLDPEYFYTRRLTRKTDVFSFGVVLFELLSGRLPVDEHYGEEQCSLVRWAQKCVKEQKLDQLVDSNIKGTIFPKCLRQFAQIAYRCLLGVPKERPTMTEVVASLQALLEQQNKSDIPFKSPGIMGFTWKIQKYLVSAPKQNSDERGTTSVMIRDVKRFTYDELKCATSGFRNNICWLGDRNGPYGELYKGWVDKTTYTPCNHNAGLPVAVKKLHRHGHFDLGVLKGFHHPNHVELIGYCLEDELLFVVYEWLHNGNFEDLLRNGAIAQLPLATKVKIALGIARGIKFLNTGKICRSHFDESDWRNGRLGGSTNTLLERHKILLDEDFTAKLSDYDISILVDGHYPQVLEYVSPYYYAEFGTLSKHLNLRSNLSGFKVLFAEVVTGEGISNVFELRKIKCFFSQCGKEYLSQIAELCYRSCNEVDSESKMVTLLREYDELIRVRMKMKNGNIS